MNMTMLQERKGRRDGSAVAGGESDDETAPLARGAERRRPSHDQGRAPTRETRWLLFLSALRFLGQVLVEVGRRALRLIERSVPRYIAFIDRLLIRIVRGSDSRLQRVMRLTVLVLLVLAVPYLMFSIQRALFSSSADAAYVSTD